MNDWLNDLKVSDIVIVSNRYHKWFDEVERLTKTQIVLKKQGAKFRKSYGDLVGSGQWDWTRLEEPTPDAVAALNEETERRDLLWQIEDNTVMDDLSTDKLNRIVEIILK